MEEHAVPDWEGDPLEGIPRAPPDRDSDGEGGEHGAQQNHEEQVEEEEDGVQNDEEGSFSIATGVRGDGVARQEEVSILLPDSWHHVEGRRDGFGVQRSQHSQSMKLPPGHRVESPMGSDASSGYRRRLATASSFKNWSSSPSAQQPDSGGAGSPLSREALRAARDGPPQAASARGQGGGIGPGRGFRLPPALILPSESIAQRERPSNGGPSTRGSFLRSAGGTSGGGGTTAGSGGRVSFLRRFQEGGSISSHSNRTSSDGRSSGGSSRCGSY